MRTAQWYAEISMVSLDPNNCFSKIKEVITICIMRIQIPSLNYYRQSSMGDTSGKCGGKGGSNQLQQVYRIPFVGTAWLGKLLDKEKMRFISLECPDSGQDKVNKCM